MAMQPRRRLRRRDRDAQVAESPGGRASQLGADRVRIAKQPPRPLTSSTTADAP